MAYTEERWEPVVRIDGQEWSWLHLVVLSELDAYTTAGFRDSMYREQTAQYRGVIVSLDGPFMDYAGVGALRKLAKLTTRHEVPVVLEVARPSTMRLMQTTSMTRHFPTFEDDLRRAEAELSLQIEELNPDSSVEIERSPYQRMRFGGGVPPAPKNWWD